MRKLTLLILTALTLVSCNTYKDKPVLTPWTLEEKIDFIEEYDKEFEFDGKTANFSEVVLFVTDILDTLKISDYKKNTYKTITKGKVLDYLELTIKNLPETSRKQDSLMDVYEEIASTLAESKLLLVDSIVAKGYHGWNESQYLKERQDSTSTMLTYYANSILEINGLEKILEFYETEEYLKQIEDDKKEILSEDDQFMADFFMFLNESLSLSKKDEARFEELFTEINNP